MIRFSLLFFLAFLSLSKLYAEVRELPNSTEIDVTEEYFDLFIESNVSTISCYGYYPEFLPELTVISKTVVNDVEEEIYTTDKGFFSKELIAFVRNEDNISYTSFKDALSHSKYLSTAIRSCLDGYFLKRDLDREKEFIEKPLIKKLYRAEERNDCNITAEEFTELGVRLENPITQKDAKKICSVINLDSAGALDVRDDFQNLQKIGDSLEKLRKREVDKFDIVYMGVEYNPVNFENFGLYQEEINLFLENNKAVDEPLVLKEFLDALYKLYKSIEVDFFLLEKKDLALLGVEVNEEFIGGINEALKTSEMAKDLVSENPIELEGIYTALLNADKGEIDYEGLKLLGIESKDDNEDKVNLKALNTILSVRTIHKASQIKSSIKGLSALNRVERKEAKKKSLTVVEYDSLGVETFLVDIEELNGFLSKPESLVNRPKPLIDFFMLLKKLNSAEFSKEDLFSLGLKEEGLVECINYAVSLKKEEKVTLKDLKKIIKTVKKLKKSSSKKVKITAKDLQTLYLSDNKRKEVIADLNLWLDKASLDRNCTYRAKEYISAIEKMHSGERENSSSLTLKDLEVLGITSSIRKIALVNEIIDLDGKGVHNIKRVNDLIAMEKKVSKVLEGKAEKKELLALGIEIDGVGKKDFYKLLERDEEWTVAEINRVLTLLKKFKKGLSERALNFSSADYFELFQLEAEGYEEFLNSLINQRAEKFKIEEIGKSFNALKMLLKKQQLQLEDLKNLLVDKKYQQKTILKKFNYILSQKPGFGKFGDVVKTLEAIEKLLLLKSGLEKTLLTKEDLLLLLLVEKEIEKERTLKAVNAFILLEKRELSLEEAKAVVGFFDSGSCSLEILNRLKIVENEELVCYGIDYSKIEIESLKTLTHFFEFIQRSKDSSLAKADISLFDNQGKTAERDFEIFIGDLNKRLKPITDEKERLKLSIDALKGKDLGGVISLPITGNTLKKYGVEALKGSGRSKTLLNFVNKALHESKLQLKRAELVKYVAIGKKVLETKEGVGTLSAEDLKSLGLKNRDGSSIKRVQLPIINEIVRAKEKDGLFYSLKEGIEKSFRVYR